MPVFASPPTRWQTWPPTETDPATVHPRTLVVIIGQRPDGPQ
jgi:hypothetical protein